MLSCVIILEPVCASGSQTAAKVINIFDICAHFPLFRRNLSYLAIRWVPGLHLGLAKNKKPLFMFITL